MPPTLDAAAVRSWCRLSLRALGRAREEIDAINVYPVADGDTGTNLYLTVESAAQSVEAVFDAHAAGVRGDPGDTDTGGDGAAPTLAEAFRALSHGALIGARGNSGTILAQLLRGMNAALAQPSGPDGRIGPDDLRRALTAAAGAGYEAVARPVEGTMLTVATRAAEAAGAEGGGMAEVARAAHAAALSALAATPAQLDALDRAGVVDAGGLGLVALLGALCEVVTGEPAADRPASGAVTSFRHAHAHPHPGPEQGPGSGQPDASGEAHPAGPGPEGSGVLVDVGDLGDPYAPEGPDGPRPADGPADQPCAEGSRFGGDGPAFEVIFLLEATDATVAALRGRLDALGDSLVVVGGDGLWNVHVHVDDVGAALEAAIDAGRPYRIRVTHFADQARRSRGERAVRAVVAVVRGDGLAELYGGAGATVVAVRPGERPASGEIAAAVRRAHAREVVLLPNDTELRHVAGAAAEQARGDGVRVALIPTRSAVQGLAALAVHEPSRRFDEDVVAMTAAAGATRYAELAVAEHRSWTTAGICQAGDVLGLIEDDVAVIGADLAETAVGTLERMLTAGGELVTLVLGPGAPPDLVDRLRAHVHDHHLAVDTVAYEGGDMAAPLLIGVE
ncbi:DAK2 domain-containing protein [Actinacidiphila reveromycinica]|uniref:DAK2 domain-containing protein n=1 Tax=Actinacidiphila reveromycinica TaxID=659352 RepID=UPI001F02A0BE|nr:DAK2 domain-containing protein [Streptomyces sp. SN-593]